MTGTPTAAPDGAGPDPVAAVRAEALKKAAVAWASCGGRPGRPLWVVPTGAGLGTVTGPGEQPNPGLGEQPRPVVSLRGDHGGVIASFPVTAVRVDPAEERWGEYTAALAQKRLNLPGTDDTVERWARECAVWELAPPETGD